MIATGLSPESKTLAMNIRRLLAKFNVEPQAFAETTGVDERTLRGVIQSRTTPHVRTIKRIADGFGVEVDELYRPVPALSDKRFDRECNALVEQVKRVYPELYVGWTTAQDDELYSQFGTGGAMTEEGILAATKRILERCEVERQFRLVYESHEGAMLRDVVRLAYNRLRLAPSVS